MHPLIKWPGGKSKEIKQILSLIPTYRRYIEPFFGGGAVFFFLEPQSAVVNDISGLLMNFYQCVKTQNTDFRNFLSAYDFTFQSLLAATDMHCQEIVSAYHQNSAQTIDSLITTVTAGAAYDDTLFLNKNDYIQNLRKMVLDKFRRTKKNNEKKPFSDEDLVDNLKTGFLSGYYMHFRDIYNKLACNALDKSTPYIAANYYFIREYCYGSMFRYNTKGKFNIPYGGISYNNKNFKGKIDYLFTPQIASLFSGTELFCDDFEIFMEKQHLTEQDFVFLDPPYDTEFSDYEGRTFGKADQERLANVLKHTCAKFILIIKNTDFIYNLYQKNFRILFFDKSYTYNVRSRNDRNVKHLIITNIYE